MTLLRVCDGGSRKNSEEIRTNQRTGYTIVYAFLSLALLSVVTNVVLKGPTMFFRGEYRFFVTWFSVLTATSMLVSMVRTMDAGTDKQTHAPFRLYRDRTGLFMSEVAPVGNRAFDDLKDSDRADLQPGLAQSYAGYIGNVGKMVTAFLHGSNTKGDGAHVSAREVKLCLQDVLAREDPYVESLGRMQRQAKLLLVVAIVAYVSVAYRVRDVVRGAWNMANLINVPAAEAADMARGGAMFACFFSVCAFSYNELERYVAARRRAKQLLNEIISAMDGGPGLRIDTPAGQRAYAKLLQCDLFRNTGDASYVPVSRIIIFCMVVVMCAYAFNAVRTRFKVVENAQYMHAINHEANVRQTGGAPVDPNAALMDALVAKKASLERGDAGMSHVWNIVTIGVAFMVALVGGIETFFAT